ncbi:MAG: helix-turn-helix domain-containing protein [Pirellulaceae bacterium]|nr:helix-turn-helix domain-containing protein [Pirellulaceae bacterium]
MCQGSDDIHREIINMVEREVFTTMLQQTDGILTQAAKRLGITRTTLRARLEALGMSVEKSTTVS